MPIFDFTCEKCKVTKEVIKKITDTSLPMCDTCNIPMVKQVGLSSFRLKGDGWYANENKK